MASPVESDGVVCVNVDEIIQFHTLGIITSTDLVSGADNDQNLLLDEELERIKEDTRKALGIDLILEKIFDNVDYFDLKYYRLINRKWYSLLMKLMKTKNYHISIPISFSPLKVTCVSGVRFRLPSTLTEPFGIEESISSPEKNLQLLNQLLENSTNFPCTNVTIFEDNLLSCDLLKFFEIFGQQIKTLKFHGPPHEEDPENPDTYTCAPVHGLEFKLSFIHILTNLTPNLESLTLQHLRFDWSTDDSIRLPNLKSFCWINRRATCGIDPFQPIPFVILDGAPNLKIIQRFHLRTDIHIIQNTGKIGTLKSLAFTPNWDAGIIEPFLSTDLQLEVLRISRPVLKGKCQLQIDQMTTVVQKLLNKNCETLKKLKLSGVGELKLRFPKFIQLKIIEIISKEDEVIRLFPQGLHLNSTFPTLRILNCIRALCTDEAISDPNSDDYKDWTKYFPPGDPPPYYGHLDSVVTVSISLFCNSQWMRNLALVCPNFIKATIFADFGHQNQFQKFLNLLHQNWSHVQEIEFRIGHFMTRVNFDSLFSGMSVEECERLRNLDVDGFPDIEQVKDLIVNPSISELKELRKFGMFFKYNYDRFDMTHLSAHYGFNRVPHLKVCIVHPPVRLRGGAMNLRLVEPFVNMKEA